MLAFLKILDDIPGFVWAIIVAILGAGCAYYAFESNVYEAKLAGAHAEFAQYREELERNTRIAMQEARTREQAMAQENERISSEAQQRIDALQGRIADLHRVSSGLRDTIARLNGRTPESSQAVTYFNEASTARELLGSCAERYTDVAGQADQLREQVIGLQEYATKVCPAPKSQPPQ